jgi:hypothetical protein
MLAIGQEEVIEGVGRTVPLQPAARDQDYSRACGSAPPSAERVFRRNRPLPPADPGMTRDP